MQRFLLLLPLCALVLRAQAAPDILIFTDGEKLIGHLVRSTGTSVVFKSDMAGEITVDWSKVAELHSGQSFAVIGKNVKLRKNADVSKIPRGTVDATAQTITVHPPAGAAAQSVPVADTANLVDQPGFEKAVQHNPGFLEDWRGAVTAGLTLVQATQKNRTFSGAVNLIRAIPTENWLEPRNRTSINFAASRGVLTQPNTPQIKTEIVHADIERDQYFPGSRFYGFAQAAFDHNFSQGLDLQQNYGGGLGWTIIKNANEALDVKGSVGYLKQQFEAPAQNHNLIGSTFGESFNRRFAHGVTFVQQLSVTPTWNEMNAYAAAGSATLAMPVFKRVSWTMSTIDTFVNDPPPGFRKNSFQLIMGLTYTLR